MLTVIKTISIELLKFFFFSLTTEIFCVCVSVCYLCYMQDIKLNNLKN